MVLSAPQRRLLRGALANRLTAACFGAGVDSTAMLVALKLADLRPDIITFADLRAEKPETLDHLHRMNAVLVEWGWEPIAVCRKETLPGTGYSDLYGNCMSNETLPSLAFGLKSCSAKWKRLPQDQLIKGVKSGPNACPPHPVWIEAVRRGERIIKLIGYDCGRVDIRRAHNLAVADADFDYAYPLQMLGWDRAACIRIITDTLGADMVPIKSACFFCPASKIWELYWLAAHHPDLLERALVLERNALTGRHSRFSEVAFGASWEHLVRNADRFPSSSTTVGLGADQRCRRREFPRPARRRRSRPLPGARRPASRRRQRARRSCCRVSGRNQTLPDKARRLCNLPQSARPGRIAGTREFVIVGTPYVAAIT